ncbi:unannotated protein [freshwater metagenome]|uniref:Unannotated protein n=1 Tax=freshwater metagenome TaxID=449393 RepID=A0A6J6XP21_9ZZZZ
MCVTSEESIVFSTPGCIGAARAVRPAEWLVSSDRNADSSRSSPTGTASAMVCLGNSCSAMATSPKARSRSTSTTSLVPLSASMAAKLVESVVLPHPPLAENTVIRRPRLGPGSAVSPSGTDWRSARATSFDRVTALAMAAMSRSSTTSRTPMRIADDKTLVSTRRRTRITPRLGR